MYTKIEGFKLHVTHSTRPFSARARFAPEACTRPDRVAKDLANVKKLVRLLEDEAAELRRLPETLKEPRNLTRSEGGDLPDEPKPAEDAAASDGVDVKIEEKKPDTLSELDEMAVDDDPREPKDRGSVAVEKRLEKLFAELELREKPAKDDGDDDAMVDEEKAQAALDAKKVQFESGTLAHVGFAADAIKCP